LSCHRHRLLLLALFCLSGTTAVAHGALIPPAVKTASPLTASDDAKITAVVTAQVAKLTAGGDAISVSQARLALIEEADNGGSATADYQTHYMNILVRSLAPVMAKGLAEQRNAAVIIGGVAQKVEKNNVANVLTPQVKTMLASNDPLISYWGVKASKYVVAASVVKNGNDGGLGKLIIDEVKKNDPAGVLAEEAYQALTLELLRNPNTGIVAQANITMGLVMDLLEWRISLYKAQAGAAPPNPQADRFATGFLSFAAWPSLAAVQPQRDRAMKDVGDLACAQLSVLKVGSDADVLDAVQTTGPSIGAIGDNLRDPGLQNVAKTFKSLGPNSDALAGKLCDDTKAAFKAVGIELSVP
jgi:hypothetical protein